MTINQKPEVLRLGFLVLQPVIFLVKNLFRLAPIVFFQHDSHADGFLDEKFQLFADLFIAHSFRNCAFCVFRASEVPLLAVRNLGLRLSSINEIIIRVAVEVVPEGFVQYFFAFRHGVGAVFDFVISTLDGFLIFVFNPEGFQCLPVFERGIRIFKHHSAYTSILIFGQHFGEQSAQKKEDFFKSSL